MHARLIKLATAIAAIAVLAVGGATLASAAHKGSSPPSPPAQVQQTGQPAPETSTEPAESAGEAADTDGIQQGDQSTSDAAGPEQEGPTASDGPGGYADSNQNADTQQEGEH